ncbi:MAG: hypothetical protein HRJ53_29515 [Acidobacteria bacterium Pan2503]|uniref:Uncharacterized protein n=1 Tax=Candidatus Acidiferrum panamense TaxID=2741543 RepID=A0A7V8NX66_9BACT|nr:hypothetical protein [Candidatus Acidoferrum panamensis]
MSLGPALPLYNAYNERCGTIALEKALRLHGVDLVVRARGSGRRRRFTSAKLYARTSQCWAPRMSDRYLVLQLITH